MLELSSIVPQLVASGFSTGRSNDRYCSYAHGYAMCKQEKTICSSLKKRLAIKTAHFLAKWHLKAPRTQELPNF